MEFRRPKRLFGLSYRREPAIENLFSGIERLSGSLGQLMSNPKLLATARQKLLVVLSAQDGIAEDSPRLIATSPSLEVPPAGNCVEIALLNAII